MKSAVHATQQHSADASVARAQKKSFFGSKDSFFKPAPVQTKLAIGKPNDAFEKEADATADRVVQRLSKNDRPSPATMFRPTNLPVQMKCSQCEQEEKVQKKDEDEKESETLQKKSAQGEEEREVTPKVMRKEMSAKAFAGPADLSHKLNREKGRGSPLPQKTRAGMESAFGTSFNNVRIHTDQNAVQMSSALNAHAFTHGNDIYFNSGKFDTGGSAGNRLLAHELTHTIQQGKSTGPASNVSAKRISPTNLNVQTLLPVVGVVAPPLIFWGGRYVLGKVIKYGIKELFEDDEMLVPIGEVIRRQILKMPVDLKGQNVFSPNAILADHIQTFGMLGEWIKERKHLFPIFNQKFQNDMMFGPEVNIRFGAMARKDGVRIRWDPVTKTYEMSPCFMELTHTAFDPTDRKLFPYLGLGIDKKDSSIYGGIAAFPAGFGGIIPADRASMEFLFDKKSITEMIFGNEFAERPFTEAAHLNAISAGNLSLSVSGYYDTGGNQTLVGAFVLLNETHSWSADLKVKVPGLTESAVPIQRDNRSQLTGLLPDIQLDGTWNFNNLVASISASYINNTLEIRGTATYTAKADDKSARIQQAEITLLVTTESAAWQEVTAQLPEEAAENIESRQDLAVAGEEGEKLVLVGWGSIGLVLFRDEEGTPKVTANAGVVLDPEGHLTVSGSIRVEEQYELMEPKGIGWTSAFYRDYAAGVGFPVGAKFTGEVCLLYKYIIGPITLYDIVVSGIYSTNPKINKELSVGARLNLSAEVSGKAAACGRLAARVGTSFPYLGLDVAAGTLSIAGEASLKAYLDMAPTIGIREAVTDGKKGQQYFVKGSIDLGAQLSLAIKGELTAELLYKDVKSVSYSNSWPVAGASIGIDFDYTLGQKLDEDALKKMAKFRKGNFEPNRFISGILKDKKIDASNKLNKGGFTDEETKKKTAATEEKTEIPHKVISPQTIVDDFNMQNQWHTLSMEVGPPGHDVDIKMASPAPKLLSEKINEQGKMIKIKRTAVTDPDQVKRLDTMLTDLEVLRKMATDVVLRAKRMGLDPAKGSKTHIPGYRELGDQLRAFGKRYNVNDLGIVVNVTPTPQDPQNIPTDIGDGSSAHPIKIRWIKRGYFENLILVAKKERWERYNKVPPKGEIHANYKKETPLEVPPTQKNSFGGKQVVTIGIAEKYQIKIGQRVFRKKDDNKRSVSGKFRTLLANYSFDWEKVGGDYDADHVLDLGWQGKDALDNLWPLYRAMNQNNGIYNQKVQYLENGQVVEGKPGSLRNKYFRVDSIGDKID